MKHRYLTLIAAIALFFFVSPVLAQNTTIRSGDNEGFFDDVTAELKTPQPRIGIPGLSFSQVIIDKEGGYIYVSTLGEYIAAMYKYAVAIASIVAVVMIIVSGFMWTASGGNPEMITSAKKRILGAVTGLILIAGSYTILYAVNPELVQFRALRVQYVKPQPLVELHGPEDDVVNGGTVETTFKLPKGNNIEGPGRSKVPSTLSDDIEDAAEELLKQGYGIHIASSFRSVDNQINEIRKNCKNPPGSNKCDPKQGGTQTCILKDMNPANCQHTTGKALDIWAT